jgi:tRNA(Ile)-lysidine synthase TilS/MesJ
MIKVNLVTGMDCDKCGRPALLFQKYSGLFLCDLHFREDLLHKAKKTVRQYKWLRPGDRIAISLHGSPYSVALLDFMRILVNGRRDVSLFAAITGDTHSITYAKSVAETFGIELFIDKETNPGGLMEDRGKKISAASSPFMQCREGEENLSGFVMKKGASVLAMAYTLEDHAMWVLWQAIQGNMHNIIAGHQKTGNFRIIRPFMHIPGRELMLYSQLVLKDHGLSMCMPDPEIIGENPLRKMLSDFSGRHPGAPFALVNLWNELGKIHEGSDPKKVIPLKPRAKSIKTGGLMNNDE